LQETKTDVEFIKNLDVTFEIVSPIRILILLYYSKAAEVKEVQQPKAIERQEQTTFL
jgi:cell division protein FtsZ